MGCRGGELNGDEIDILTNNIPICEHIKKNWKLYIDWADRSVSFGVDNEGDSIQVRDLLKIIESAVAGTAAKTKLNDAVLRSKLEKKDFISIVARTAYESPRQCPDTIKQFLKECTGYQQ
jgi:hypothetical protein